MSIKGENYYPLLQKIEADSVDLTKKCDPMTNNFFIMVNAGSKGSYDNFKSVAFILGEQKLGHEKYPINVKGRLSMHTISG